MDCSRPGLPVHHQLLEFTQAHVHWISDAIQPSHPLSFLSAPTFNLSQHQGFSNESVLRIRWPKYWSFSFSISPSNENSGLISLGLTGLISLMSKGLKKFFWGFSIRSYRKPPTNILANPIKKKKNTQWRILGQISRASTLPTSFTVKTPAPEEETRQAASQGNFILARFLSPSWPLLSHLTQQIHILLVVWVDRSLPWITKLKRSLLIWVTYPL